MSTVHTITLRDVSGTPSSRRTAFFKQPYLKARLMLGIEYIQRLTDSHRTTPSWRGV